MLPSLPSRLYQFTSAIGIALISAGGVWYAQSDQTLVERDIAFAVRSRPLVNHLFSYMHAFEQNESEYKKFEELLASARSAADTRRFVVFASAVRNRSDSLSSVWLSILKEWEPLDAEGFGSEVAADRRARLRFVQIPMMLLGVAMLMRGVSQWRAAEAGETPADRPRRSKRRR